MLDLGHAERLVFRHLKEPTQFFDAFLRKEFQSPIEKPAQARCGGRCEMTLDEFASLFSDTFGI